MAFLAPRTLTQLEVDAVLSATEGNIRDHVIISVALGTGLRIGEIVGLNVGDLFHLDGTPRKRFQVRAEIAKGGHAADAFVPDRLQAKLVRFREHKRQRGEGLDPNDPLFCSQSRTRLSIRRIQVAWHRWQRVAGLGRTHPFHALRHTAVTNVYRASQNLFLAQRFARHASPLTTTIYTHPSDEEAWEKVRSLEC